MTKSTPTLTLTQSELLAVLLQRQRSSVIQLAQRRTHHKQARPAFWSTFTWPWRALTVPTLVGDSAEPFCRNRPVPHYPPRPSYPYYDTQKLVPPWTEHTPLEGNRDKGGKYR